MRLTRQMVSWKNLSLLSALLLLQLSGCTATSSEDNDTTNTFITIVAMVGQSFDGTTQVEGSDVFSDVCITTEDNPTTCVVSNDNGIVTMQAQPKNLTDVSSLVNDIVFTRYRVTFVRADGRNVPGVDVPYPFDGVANFRVPVDGTEVTRVFMLVRNQAKLESPLNELTRLGGSLVISTIARVDFFGQDLAGRQLQVTGFINVTFADYAND